MTVVVVTVVVVVVVVGGGGGDSNGGGDGDDGEDCNAVMGDHYLHWERLPQRRHFAIVAHVLDRQRVSCRHDVRLLVAAEVTVVLRSTCAVQGSQWRTRQADGRYRCAGW